MLYRVIVTGPAESRTSATAPSGTMSPSALRTLSCLTASASTRKGASAWMLTCQGRPGGEAVKQANEAGLLIALDGQVVRLGLERVEVDVAGGLHHQFEAAGV